MPPHVQINIHAYRSWKDVTTWWDRKFERSLQRMEGHWGAIECAVLAGDKIGDLNGIYGGPADCERSEELLARIDEFQLGDAWNELDWTPGNFVDIRDCDFEDRPDAVEPASHVSYRIGRGVKAVKVATHASVLCGRYRPPKKGKLDKKSVKNAEGLRLALEEYSPLFDAASLEAAPLPEFGVRLARAIEAACGAMLTVASNEEIDETRRFVDQSRRELKDAQEIVSRGIAAEEHAVLTPEFVSTVCSSLTSAIVPMNSIMVGLECIGRKRKSAGIACLIEAHCELLSAIIGKLGDEVAATPELLKSSASGFKSSYPDCEVLVTDELLEDAIKDIIHGNNETRARVNKVLRELKGCFERETDATPPPPPKAQA